MAALLTACNGKNCGGNSCPAAPYFLVSLNDAQGRDLFNVATPAHYDTAVFNNLNKGVARVGPSPFKQNAFCIFSAISPGSITLQLKISATDVDTVVYNADMVKGCCPDYAMKSFSYNGVSYADSLATRNFLVIKQ